MKMKFKNQRMDELLEQFNETNAAILDERTMSWWMAYMNGEITLAEANRHAPVETIVDAYRTFIHNNGVDVAPNPEKLKRFSYYEVWSEEGWEIAFWDGNNWYNIDLEQPPMTENILRVVRRIERTDPDYVPHPVEC